MRTASIFSAAVSYKINVHILEGQRRRKKRGEIKEEKKKEKKVK